MASWLTSKLKAAEQILNQIDQQAAESLKNQETIAGDQQEQYHEVFSPIPTSHPPQQNAAAANTYRSTAQAPNIHSRSEASVSYTEADWTQLLASDSEASSKPPKVRPTSKRPRAQKKKKGGVSKDFSEKHADKFETVELDVPDAGQSENELLLCKSAIAERESFVHKLEMEKEALERLVSEREGQQRKEASELKTGMVELMQATDLERQRHSRTRMEALARESTLQNQSLELVKKLAAAQRVSDAELTGLVDARTKVEIKRVSIAELERKLLKLRTPPSVQKEQSLSSLYEEKHQALYEIDYCKSQLKNIQDEIVSTKQSQQVQSQREVELEARLVQLTDHLIHKQAQVESLSTEKATLFFRLETLASQDKLTKNNSPDIEYGPTTSRDKPAFELVSWYRETSNKVDNLFIQGSRILGMNRTTRALAAAYIALLHGWVIFVLVRAV